KPHGGSQHADHRMPRPDAAPKPHGGSQHADHRMPRPDAAPKPHGGSQHADHRMPRRNRMAARRRRFPTTARMPAAG
ncbi:MAG: hypothetical protein ACRDT9_04630, partial [Agromyces sp.]